MQSKRFQHPNVTELNCDVQQNLVFFPVLGERCGWWSHMTAKGLKTLAQAFQPEHGARFENLSDNMSELIVMTSIGPNRG